MRKLREFLGRILSLDIFVNSRLSSRKPSDEKKLLNLIQNGELEKLLDENQRAMMHSILELSETEVHEIMVPRTDMICVEENTNLQELARIIATKGHTRIPLYSQTVDNILGLIHAKDLLQFFVDGGKELYNLRKLARPAYFVPENKRVHQLLRDFQREQHHMAIVVDEYGGTAGLVTFEDVIEEIIGDIQDEYDQEFPLHRKIDDQTFVVDAKIDLHDLNEKLNINLPTEGGYESLGGFILSVTGYVPEENEVIRYDRFTFTVEEVDRNRIIQVRIHQMPESVEEDPSETPKSAVK